MDELVLLEQSVNLINGPLIFLQLLHLSAPSHTIDIFEGFVFCSVRFLLLHIAIYHRAIGGLGIAGVRVICISFPFEVIRIGADKLVKCTSRMTCFLSLLFAVALYVEVAILAPEIIEWLFNEDKFIEVGVITKYLSESYFQFFTGYSCLVFNAAEFLCYIILLVEMYKHHLRHKKLCLQNESKLAKLKKRRNAVTTLGHFTSWSVEIIIFGFAQYMLVTSIDTTNFNIWILIYFQLLVPCINYVIFPTVQALTSEDLRDNAFNIAWFKDIFLCISDHLNENGNNVGGEISQGIELHLLENGNTANDSNDESKNDSICDLFDAHTKSCIFHHEITSAITPRRGNLAKSFSL